MPFYKYQAKNSEGETYERTIEAADRFAIYKVIREEGGTVVMIQEKKKTNFNITFHGFRKGIKTQDKINLAKNLSSMIDAGLPVTRALSVMGRQAKNKKLKALLHQLEDGVSHGDTLSSTLKAHPHIFSPLFISMVRAGEESGSVSSSLKIVANQIEKSYMLTKKITGAMIYPGVIITVMLIIAVLLLVYMVPTLTATFSGMNIPLPLPTRVLIGTSNFLIANSISVALTTFAVIAGTIFFLRTKRGHSTVDVVSIKIPVIGEMVREVQVARTARTLSSLLNAGVEIVGAIEVTQDVLQNHLYKEAMDNAHNVIQKGELLSTVFTKYEKLYPVFVGEMVAVGEETGKIAEMLTGVADFYEEQVDRKTKDLSTIIEPVLMIIIGVGVGIFAVSMLAPTYSLADYI